jgi:hypothetical protein
MNDAFLGAFPEMQPRLGGQFVSVGYRAISAGKCLAREDAWSRLISS